MPRALKRWGRIRAGLAAFATRFPQTDPSDPLVIGFNDFSKKECVKLVDIASKNGGFCFGASADSTDRHVPRIFSELHVRLGTVETYCRGPTGERPDLKIVIQRVSQARVRVDEKVVGEIERGLLVLVGFGPEDREGDLEWVSDKLWGLRIFPDDAGRMNRSVADIGGAILLVSQFTLYGDAARGRRPSFVGAAPPEQARELYDRLVQICRSRGTVAEGEFGATMFVESTNDGPVTLLLER